MVRLPSLRWELRSTLDANSAGARPNRTVVASDRTTANPNTQASNSMYFPRGRNAWKSGRDPRDAEKMLMVQPASNVPEAPASTARAKPSINNCRIKMLRPAPRAVRTANSFCRVNPLERRRVATLTQAMSKSRHAAPKKKKRKFVVLAKSVKAWRRVSTWTPQSPSSFGYSRASRWTIVVISVRARARSTPRFRRPKAGNMRLARFAVVAASSASGIYRSGSG